MTLPELHLADWRPTKDTLHLYCQIVGKIRLATTAPRNHWWNVPLYVDVRGLTTRRLHHQRHDVRDHDRLPRPRPRRSDGGRSHRSFSLGDGMPVADFDAQLHDVAPRSRRRRRDQGEAVRGPDDDAVPPGHEHAVLGSRSGRSASAASSTGPTPSSRSSAAGSTARRARCTSSGTASTSPSPASRVGRADTSSADPRHAGGLLARGHLVRLLARRRQRRRRRLLLLHGARARRACATSRWPLGAWIALGVVVSLGDPPLRGRPDRRPIRAATLLAFCQSAYEAGARLAGWDTTAFNSSWCPTPNQLRELQATAAADFGRPGARP